jgi:hypothetical protein
LKKYENVEVNRRDVVQAARTAPQPEYRYPCAMPITTTVIRETPLAA